MSDASVKVLLFSDDSDTRRAIIDAVGVRASKTSPRIEWHEAATASGVEELVAQHDFAAIVLDAEATKEGGLSIARNLQTYNDDLPPFVILTARPQDAWLATWAGAQVILPAPFNPIEVQEGIAQVLDKRSH